MKKDFLADSPLPVSTRSWTGRFAAFRLERMKSPTLDLNESCFDREYFRPYQYLLQEVVRPGQERSFFITFGVEL